MLKILIIGSEGMLGQELVKVFSVDKNYEVIGWDKEEVDITKEAQVKAKILPLAPQIIINAAAYNNVDKCEDPAGFAKAKELNGLAPGYLAQAAKEIKIPPSPPFAKWGKGAVFVHYSSDYVFDGSKKEGYKEDDEPSPISNYGWSKLLGEKQVQQVGGKFYLIRLQKLFGWPAQSSGAKKSFFYNMMTLAKDKKELELIDDELANFTYAPDLARQTKLLIEGITPSQSPPLKGGEKVGVGFDEKKFPYGIYHITNEGLPVTWYGAARALFMIINQRHPERSEGSLIDSSATPQNDSIPKLIPVSADKFPRPAKRPKHSVLLNTKLPPLRPWPKALKEFLGQ